VKSALAAACIAVQTLLLNRYAEIIQRFLIASVDGTVVYGFSAAAFIRPAINSAQTTAIVQRAGSLNWLA
jgi:hypothetical protein